MATIRVPYTEGEFHTYLPELLLISHRSPSGENQFANSGKTVSVSPGDALAAAEDWSEFCDGFGFGTFEIVRFRVNDGNGDPIEDAKVWLSVDVPEFGTYKRRELTNRRGKALFQVVRGSRIEATVSKDGYRTRTFSGAVEGRTPVDVELVDESESRQTNQQWNEASLFGKVGRAVGGIIFIAVLVSVVGTVGYLLLHSGFLGWLVHGTIPEIIGRLIGMTFLGITLVAMIEGMFV